MLRTAQTENGTVKGLPGNNYRITSFKGIPFAAPPVGKNRWRAPQPAENWDGIKECYGFKPISVQDTPGLGDDIYCREWHVDPDIEMDEDCLYLNVWTPAKKIDEKLPVLVWFFGGAFQWGYPNEMEFNGENVAKRGVIVVSVNYRLGALGFLAHPELTKESEDAPANFGNLDQLAGLKWVKRNIASFGGDPDNITIAGQSAGGGSVFNHLTSEQSIGNFNKAVIFSGIIRFPYFEDKVLSPQPLEYMEKMGERFFKFLGVKTLDEARKLDAYYIRDKYAEFRTEDFKQFPAEGIPMPMSMFVPCIDGKYLKDDPFRLFLEGRHAHVPILSGNTGDEFKAYFNVKNESEIPAKAKEIFGSESEKFLSFEEAGKKDFMGYIPTDSVECATKVILENNDKNSFYYLFEPDIPGYDNPGTFHSVDLWFFFDNLQSCWRPFTGRHYDLAREMCDYYTNFIKCGNPNGLSNDKTSICWKPFRRFDRNEMHFTPDGSKSSVMKSKFNEFIMDWTEKKYMPSKKQAFNPYLPSWEYVPDGEPYVFGDRVYVYGSHDNFGGHGFCLNDYVCWSAPVDDLGNWRYEGVIYTRLDDAENYKNNMCLYAPDVAVGPDGRYYLYYVLDKVNIVSVAVCDTPSGRFKFYGYVHYQDGTRLGEKNGDEPQFDPGVLTIDDKTYLFTGFCGQGDKSRHGAMCTILDKDMLTIIRNPEIVIPGNCYSKGTAFEGHSFFEAPSIRTFDKKFYLIYSSEVMHELCYAISDKPEGPYEYGGVIVSNTDIGIDTYKSSDTPGAFGANNHGSLIEINSRRYIFYHRHTNNNWYSRQGCAEPVEFMSDGAIKQSEITSCGLNNGPLNDIYEYPSYIACNIMKPDTGMYVGEPNVPFITQEGKDGDMNEGFVTNITNDVSLGYKYFEVKDVTGIELYYRGYASGEFIIRSAPDGDTLATLPVDYTTIWTEVSSSLSLPNGITSLYITFKGQGNTALKSFRFLH